MKVTDNNGLIANISALLVEMGLTTDFEVLALSAGGSNRQYYRVLADGKSYVATYVPDPAEGMCFVNLAQTFRAAGASVPEVFIASSDGHYYIQEDLGDTSLFSVLASQDCTEIVKETLSRLVALQKIPEDVWRPVCISKDFSRRQVMWDLNYFKYEFLKPREVIFDEDALEDEFSLLSDRLLSIPDRFLGFMMRDCQSRNVMLTAGGPVFIDFQGGRFGPALYDAVSFLWQARAGFSSKFRENMLNYYCGLFCGGDSDEISEMMSYLDDIVLFRTLQVLGAYGFRGIVQKKSHFLLSIPGALANLKELIERGALDAYPELKKACIEITENSMNSSLSHSGKLKVEIFSFSYKKGYPEDMSGNGGGFMFDCRAMHNPGRYKEYKHLTGRDREVVDFLEQCGEVQSFLRNAWGLTDPTIERYLSRGFTHLQIGFGCTGGQHRSVYCAQSTAAHINEVFPEAEVVLIHREHP